LAIGSERSSGKFCYARDGSAAAGDEVNVGTAEFFQDFGGLREEYVLY